MSVIEFIPSPSNDSTSEPNSALQKLSIVTPGAKYPAIINNNALIISPKRPKVKRLIGKVINVISGRIKMLINAIIKQIIIALQKFATSIPGINQPTNKTASVKSIHLKNNITVGSFRLYL